MCAANGCTKMSFSIMQDILILKIHPAVILMQPLMHRNVIYWCNEWDIMCKDL